ncbi:MAG TPA: hypothetical protein PLP82_06395 [Deltaproteobacteria bacterium]|nr:hypothetical protein [Deltaproteobacteria bacterium]HPR03516.1 hypothetical protein [Deltaproteobacteria bacterium]
MKKILITSVLIVLGSALPAAAYRQDGTAALYRPMETESWDGALSVSGDLNNTSFLSSLEESTWFSLPDQGMPSSYSMSKGMDQLGKSDPVFKGITLQNDQTLLAQSDSDELTHQALTPAMFPHDMFYFVSASGSLPVLDETFRDFIDYGATVSFGTGKRISEKLSITATIGVSMMTGDWSIKGDRESIEVAAEEYYPGIVTEPGVVITPEDLPDENLGTSYHSEAEATITSSESLESIDIHTDLYLFPVSINALYRFKHTDKLNAYAGGGLGFCVATRDCDSGAIKEKYFSGPEYKVSLNKSQTVTGLLVNLVAGVNIPVYENMKFVAEASTTLYDLKAFDPVMEISFTKPNPDWYEGSDLTQWSYEDPLRVGVYKEVYVTNISAGLVMPF